MFKKEHKIVSRKITDYVTPKDIREEEDIEARGKEFVDKIRNLLNPEDPEEEALSKNMVKIKIYKKF